MIPKPSETEIEALVRLHTYPAQFKKSGPISTQDGQRDPVVEITGPNGTVHKAKVVFSTNGFFSDESNAARQKLIDEKGAAGDVDVTVLGAPTYSSNYRVIGASGKIIIKGQKPEVQYDITASQARQVLVGEKIFSSIHMIPKGNNKHPIMRMHAFNGKKATMLVGFVKAPEKHSPSRDVGIGVRQRLADYSIGRDIIMGSKERKPLSPGDYLITREQRMSLKKKVVFVEPVINIMRGDEAYNPAGIHIWTFVEGYDVGSYMHNIPITGVGQAGTSGGMAGLGHVVRPSEESKEFFYKPIIIYGAARDKGKYVGLVKILKNDDKVIFAEKVEG